MKNQLIFIAQEVNQYDIKGNRCWFWKDRNTFS